MNKKTTYAWVLLCLGCYGAGYWNSEWLRKREDRENLCRLIGYAINEGYLLVDTNRLYADSDDYPGSDDAADVPMDDPVYTNAVGGSGIEATP